jgi:hypothetical protein
VRSVLLPLKSSIRTISGFEYETSRFPRGMRDACASAKRQDRMREGMVRRRS